jgi:hypothetical protein
MSKSKPSLVVASFAVALALGATAFAQINVVRDLGCRVNDPSFDNGLVLNEAFAKAGQELNEEFYLPGGAYYCPTPLVLPARSGLSIRGNGIGFAMPEGAYEGRTGGPVSRIIYTGPAEHPAVTYRGMGLKLDGIMLQRGVVPVPRTAPVRDGSIGLEISGNPGGLPSGKLYAPQLAIYGFDTAIYVSPLPREDHADQNQFGYLSVQGCRTVFRSDNLKSVGNQFQMLLVNGDCDTVFDVRRGGHLIVDNLLLNRRALVLKLHDPSANNANYEIRSLRVDNHAAGWRLVEMLRPDALRLRVGGLIGRRAIPADDAIQLLGDPRRHDVVIDLWHDGQKWPGE